MGQTKLKLQGEETQAKNPPEARLARLASKRARGGKKHKAENLVVAVNAESTTEPAQSAEGKKSGRRQKVKSHGKRYLAARAKVDPAKVYPMDEAAKLVRETSISRFPGSIELHLVLIKGGVNTRVELPYSSGAKKRVEIANDKTIQKLQAGKIDFDILLATPSMMPKLVPFAKLLGPKGLMPNPKQGTISDNPEKAKASFEGNAITVKTEKSAPLIHTVVGKSTQSESELVSNTKAIFNAVGQKNIQKAVIVASMGPGIQVQVG